jgi:hypothetical protein
MYQGLKGPQALEVWRDHIGGAQLIRHHRRNGDWDMPAYFPPGVYVAEIDSAKPIEVPVSIDDRTLRLV